MDKDKSIYDRPVSEAIAEVKEVQAMVNKLLDAAELQRAPRPDNSLTAGQKYSLILAALGTVAAIAIVFMLFGGFELIAG